ncbi:PREDICTED: uncharacterized protein LOC105571108 [Vollenhovia emeryi]|uniref:uncharacterized protein LOC105571108 n=1 Tax=Vollenhovia emeryi TaxID=411798 RepID=UPI0005F4057D|nr:PREDICTED: uncharacterized protein LOC105571108 [Vollenhovia emeryi]
MGEQFGFTLSGYKPDKPRSRVQKTISERRKSENTRDQLEPRVGCFFVSCANHRRLPAVKATYYYILSTIAKLFDPLGWVTPVTIKAKIFLQLLWRLKADWDDEIPEELFDKWRTIYHHLTELNNLELPRWIGTDATATLSEIHGFADASSVAYAAVVYLKTVSKSGKITISLLTAKSKVAPVKPLSIPRLELSAAVLLSRLICFVQCSLRVEISRCVCWTDSTIVLAWLKQHPSQWKTFVANRVSEVQANVPAASWPHVPTQDNPVDCASRGLLGRDLKGFKLWWQGPNWLRCSPDNWPNNVATAHSDVEMEHKRELCIPLSRSRNGTS